MSEPNDQLINQSDQRIPLCSLSSWSLFHLLRTFHAVIVLLFLRNSSRISTFDTSVRNGTESQSLSLSCVSNPGLFISQYSVWQRVDLKEMDYRSKFPLHGIILCSRTGHTYIYLQPDRNGCRIEPLLCSRTGQFHGEGILTCSPFLEIHSLSNRILWNERQDYSHKTMTVIGIQCHFEQKYRM